jgi:hypothetical protein
MLCILALYTLQLANKNGNAFFGFVWNTASKLFGLTVEKGASSHIYLASS